MNDYDAEVLDYPSAHRDRAIALMHRRDELTTAGDSMKPTATYLQRVRLSRAVCYLAVLAALITAGLGWAGALADFGTNTVMPTILLITIVAYLVFHRAADSLDRRKNIDTALDVLDRQLATLHNDYTDSTEGTLQDDLTLIDDIIAGPYPGRTKFLTLTMITGIIVILFIIGVGALFGKLI